MTIFRGFFFFFLAALLATTIPNVAYFFRAYEPINDNLDLLWWIVSYALATGIDVTIYLLCSIIARSKQENKDVQFVWFFILLLTALSCYMNYEHATQFQSSMLSHASPLMLPYVGSINSFIASSFPIMVVAFTWMSGKLNDNTIKETLEQKATRLENEQNAKLRIRQARKINVIERIKDMKELAKTISAPSLTAPITPEYILPAPSLDTSNDDHVNLTWNTDGNVSTVQFPNRDAVQVDARHAPEDMIIPASSSEIPIDTDTLATIALNGHTDMQDDFTSFINMLKQ